MAGVEAWALGDDVATCPEDIRCPVTHSGDRVVGVLLLHSRWVKAMGPPEGHGLRSCGVCGNAKTCRRGFATEVGYAIGAGDVEAFAQSW